MTLIKFKILYWYRNLKKFKEKHNLVINEAIETGEIDTGDIKVNFKEWMYEKHPKIPVEDIWDYEEHYNNGLTHRENEKLFLKSKL